MKLSHWVGLAAVGAVAYVLIKRPAVTEPIVAPIRNVLDQLRAPKVATAPQSSTNLDPTTVSASPPSVDLTYQPSLGTEGLDTGGPAAPLPYIPGVQAAWRLSDPNVNN